MRNCWSPKITFIQSVDIYHVMEERKRKKHAQVIFEFGQDIYFIHIISFCQDTNQTKSHFGYYLW